MDRIILKSAAIEKIIVTAFSREQKNDRSKILLEGRGTKGTLVAVVSEVL